jgi:hypothetical protein
MKTVIFVNSNHLFISGLCLRHLTNLKETIDGIVVITPHVERLESFYHWMGFDQITFLSDSEVCQTLNIPSDRLSWIDKQYAILNLDKLVNDDIILNVDADIIFNTELKLTQDTARRFYIETECYQPYFDTIFDFFGLKKSLPQWDSFISDFMIFDSKYLKEMRKSTTAFDSYYSWKSIVDKNTPTTDQYKIPAISEYEMYGTWLYANYPDVMILDRTSSTYGKFEDNVKYHKFIPSIENLKENKTIIPLRQTYDTDIDWDLIYPKGWQSFK